MTWMVEAMRQSMTLAKKRGFGPPEPMMLEPEGTDFDHLDGMADRITPEFSADKIGRWLGWMQGALAAKGWITLEEAKVINLACSQAAGAPEPGG